MAPRDHALLSPSAAGRWLLCPASVALTAYMPEETSPYALRGTAAHAAAESVITGRPYQAPAGAESVSFEELKEEVQQYTEFVRSETRGDFRLIEQRLEASWLAAECYGTADAVILHPDEIHVIDLKTGRGVQVKAKDNPQLAIYARSVVETFAGMFEDLSVIKMTIVQPPLNHIETWQITPEELIKITDEMKPAAAECLKELAEMSKKDARLKCLKFNPGTAQCRFCRARHTCAALASYCLTAAGLPALTVCDPKIDNVQLAKIMQKIPAIELWITAMKERAGLELSEGRVVPGYKLVQGRAGNRTWRDPAAAASLLESCGLSKDQIYAKKLVSPAQADKLIKKSGKLTDEQAAAYSDMIIKPAGAPVIAEESDPRPAYRGGLTADDYPDESIGGKKD